MDEVVMQLQGVVKCYGKGVLTRVVHGVDLCIQRGQCTAIIGPSGSGKSTLLNIMGLLDRPTQGRVIVTGKDTSSLPESEMTRLRATTLGFVFQFHHLLAAFTALENVILPMWSLHGKCTAQMREQAANLLHRVGLGNYISNKATELSGGQKQRVAIARALALQPKLLLADEPTGNLDTTSADQIFRLLCQFSEEQHSALVVVTHDPRLANRCDRIVKVVDGRIQSDSLNPNATH